MFATATRWENPVSILRQGKECATGCFVGSERRESGGGNFSSTVDERCLVGEPCRYLLCLLHLGSEAGALEVVFSEIFSESIC